MDNDGGRDVALRRNPATGRFDVQWDETGNIVFDDSDSHTVLSLLAEDREGYWADRTGQRGSLLSTLKDDVTGTDKLLVSYCRQALQFAVDRNEIRSVEEVTAVRRAPGRYDVSIKYRNRDGHERNVRVPFGV